jgi:hypothetical protein
MESKEANDILQELKNEHQEFIELLKMTNQKLDKLIDIMEDTKAKPTDSVM